MQDTTRERTMRGANVLWILGLILQAAGALLAAWALLLTPDQASAIAARFVSADAAPVSLPPMAQQLLLHSRAAAAGLALFAIGALFHVIAYPLGGRRADQIALARIEARLDCLEGLRRRRSGLRGLFVWTVAALLVVPIAVYDMGRSIFASSPPR